MASALIEVKTTNGWERTPFHITRNELAVAEERRSEWRLFRLWNFSREPKAFELHRRSMPTSHSRPQHSWQASIDGRAPARSVKNHVHLLHPRPIGDRDRSFNESAGGTRLMTRCSSTSGDR
jgi:hypothetical protein